MIREGMLMRNLIIGIILIFAIWVIPPFIGINTSYIVPDLIEWATKFILPWIILYWLIRLIKNSENK
ncbi:hypothetical protein ABE26_10575 [Cytobacillus firmus]|nr:hypothetical protein [Cytobacillus firmus]